jgi:hypothetical protein
VDLAAQRRLRDTQMRGGLADAVEACRSDEVLQRAKIHCRPVTSCLQSNITSLEAMPIGHTEKLNSVFGRKPGGAIS